jgi:hypothetical protein
MTSYRRFGLTFLLALMVAACATNGSGLNSDRIERTFGSYGVEVLAADETERVTSLYSRSGAQRITRTYAVVEFTDTSLAAYRGEHESIEAGASIGATFRSGGWDIRKHNLFIGELEVPASYDRLAALMDIDLPETLATHQYLFVVSRDEREWNYATITEVHHPEYLTVNDLRELYGEILFDDSNRDSIHDFIGPPATK